MTLQRSETKIIRDAISQFVASGESDFEIDGYTVLVSRAEAPELYNIGMYRPGSTPEGTCDDYYVCDAAGETGN